MGKARRQRPRKRGWSRRDFLRRAGFVSTAVATAPLLASCSANGGGRDPDPGSEPGSVEFKHGVASGDPLQDKVILWTRVTPATDGTVSGEVQVASDPAFTRVVQTSRFSTDASKDYTVKVDQGGLSPATTYYYRFSVGKTKSVIGRTRTAADGGLDRLRVGVVSCSSYAHGYFSAYKALAKRADLDVVLHLGDYIYEYGSGEYGSAREYQPSHEILTLDDYRTRHGYYKLDPDVQEVHRQHPFITVWDDHETANDSYRDGAENHTEGTEGVWAQRKAWGVQAYAEWLPIRLPDAANPLRIYRQFRYGNLAEFVMLDTRLEGRDEQAGLTDASSINDANRHLISTTQFDFLSNALSTTSAKWKLLGQQVMFGQLRILGLPELSLLTGLPIPQLEALVNSLPVVSTGGLIINPDQWDGYRGERNRIFDLIESVGGGNIAVLTGDIHTSWAMDLSRDPSNPLVYNPLNGSGSLAVEFVATSVTSPGLDQLAPLQGLLPAMNPHMKYVDLAKKGYLLLDVTPERLQGEWWYSDTIATSSEVESFGAGYFTADGDNHLSKASAPSEARADAPAPAP